MANSDGFPKENIQKALQKLISLFSAGICYILSQDFF